MKKGGQFFLVAALVIIAVVASLATVYNNVKVSQQDVSVYDLSKDIKYEGLQYLASKSYYSSDSNEIKAYLEQLVLSYSQSYPNTNIIIVYGNLTAARAIEYNSTSIGCISLLSSCQSSQVHQITYTEQHINMSTSAGSATIVFNGAAYSFDINEQGQNFFLVFLKKQDFNGNIFVANPAPPECKEEGQPCYPENLCCTPLSCNNNICELGT